MKTKLPRLVRLLPAVVLASAALLVLNGTGLVRDGAALAQSFAQTDAPANKDYAEPDQQIATAAEADILTSLSRRHSELDARQASIQMQADVLAATEKRVDAKIAQLQALQNKITALLGDRDAAQKAQIAALVKTYSSMKKADAARIFNNLPDDVEVPVAQQMNAEILGNILGSMSPDAAQKLTVKLANRLTLPQTTDAPVPAAPGPAAQTASAAPAAPAATPKQP